MLPIPDQHRIIEVMLRSIRDDGVGGEVALRSIRDQGVNVDGVMNCTRWHYPIETSSSTPPEAIGLASFSSLNQRIVLQSAGGRGWHGNRRMCAHSGAWCACSGIRDLVLLIEE